MRPSIYLQTGLQDRQCHAPCTLGKTSRCWLDLCFHDKDLAHCPVKQVRDHLWLNKTLPNIWKIFTICSILFYKTLVKSLPNFCQIFSKNLTTDRLVHSTNTILAHSGRMTYFRENSNESYSFMASQEMQKEIQTGFETQDRRHLKSKPGVSVATRKELVSCRKFKKERKKCKCTV